jgi:hypothetical protein
MSHDNARTLLSRARRKLKELYNNCRKWTQVFII